MRSVTGDQGALWFSFVNASLMGEYPRAYNIFFNYEIAACAIFRVFSSKGTFKCDKIKPIESPLE